MLTFYPSKILATYARQIQTEKVKNSIVYLIKECSTKLKLKNDNISLSLQALSSINWLPPEIHYYHHALQSTMKRQEVNKTLISLNNLLIEILNISISNDDIVISSIGNSEWENFISNEAIKVTLNECKKIAEIKPINEFELSQAKNIFNIISSTLSRYDSNMLDEILEQVRIIKLFNGQITMGLTDVRMLGAMFIRLPRSNLNPMLYFLEHLIHEASHIHLNCLMTIDPLILNSPDERYQSPLRQDLRPMFGVYHATFVSARVARTMMKLYTETNCIDLLHPLAESLDEVLRGINEIEQHAKLTFYGRLILKDMRDVLDASKSISAWQRYDFNVPRTHRFGSGITKVNEFMRLVS